jgi:hypothetical protein
MDLTCLFRPASMAVIGVSTAVSIGNKACIRESYLIWT